jgi:hypothetical protein
VCFPHVVRFLPLGVDKADNETFLESNYQDIIVPLEHCPFVYVSILPSYIAIQFRPGTLTTRSRILRYTPISAAYMSAKMYVRPLLSLE